MNTTEILKKYWGYDSFRPLQQEIINSVLDKKDTLALLPTGGGKSICYQVPSMAMEGICLVISPLIALMKDQVEGLKKKNIPALLIYSGMKYLQVKLTLENASHGNYKFLYVSPERLQSELFLEYLPALNINLVAVDEAHCISQWGYDFRPSYLQIATLREFIPDKPILALTASATREVQDDICEKLLFRKDHQRFQGSFLRPNLSYSVFKSSSKQNKLLEIIRNVPGSGIVYCKSRKRTKEVSDLLRMHGIKADHYHAGLSHTERSSKQDSWLYNETRVMACTNAFGMGIDKSDVRTVVHYDIPDSLESYYQEAGRAGRDGKRSYAVLLYNDTDIKDLNNQTALRFPPYEEIKKIYRALVNYLQLPSESGEGIYFDFDLNDFIRKFDLNGFTATYALKVLEQEGYISYNEQIFLPATAVFTVNKNDLAEFERSYPEMEPMVKGLLRSYEGIFDNPTPVFEKQLSSFLKKDIGSVKEDLNKLHYYGIIEFTPQKDKPQILFLRNRVTTEDLYIDQENIRKRKEAFEMRLKAMTGYISSTDCRSGIIAHYFTGNEIPRCGICDNCIAQNDNILSDKDFKAIEKNIRANIELPVNIDELMLKLRDFKKEHVWTVINFMRAENLISVNKDGEITITKPLK